MMLRRHGLIEPYATPLEAMGAVFAVQTQYAASLPMALAVRTHGLKAGWHKKLAQNDLVKSWTLRHTLHAQSASDHDLFLAAAGQRMFDRYVQFMTRSGALDEKALREMMDGILVALERGPLTRPEIHEHVPAWKEISWTGWGADVMGLAYLGKVKLLITDGGPTQFALHTAEAELEREEATQELVRRYFSNYGPATYADFNYWTGLPAGLTKAAFEAVKPELTPVEIEGIKGQRWVYRPEVTEDVPKVKLLAKFDPLTMGHKDKSLFLPEKYRTQVIRIAGQIEAAVLINGQMAGTWRLTRKGKGGEITVEPFTKIAKARFPAIEREARRVGKALGLNPIGVKTVSLD